MHIIGADLKAGEPLMVALKIAMTEMRLSAWNESLCVHHSTVSIK